MYTRFWARNMRDHARFVYEALPSPEREERQRAFALIRIFEAHLQAKELDRAAAIQDVGALRGLLLRSLRRHIGGEAALSLSPSRTSHMITEGDEWGRMLRAQLQPETAMPPHPMVKHLLWLPVMASGAHAMQAALDSVEQPYLWQLQAHARGFMDLHRHAQELSGFMRTGLTRFPALERFLASAEASTESFLALLKELTKLAERQALLGRPPLHELEHAYREAHYYYGLFAT